MAIRERLVYAIDVVTDGANKGLANFKKSVGDAEGATGKFKAGAASAFDSVKANAAALALGAGAALVAFGAKAVSAFQETALEAGKFSDATGLAVEDASRWIEVAGDVGVSAETMQGAFIRLNKAIGDGSPAVEKYGLSLITAADGTADVNATMLTAIERIGGIKDPTERAAAAQEVFGRSYAQAAEIIFDNADNVAKKLGEVSEAKVIDEEELEKARRFREAMDNLKDSVEDISLVVGETLVPVLEEFASGLTMVSKAADKLKVLKIGSEVAGWLNPVKKVGDELRGPVVDGITDAGKAIKGWFGSGGEAEQAFQATTTAQDQYVESLGMLDAARERAQEATIRQTQVDSLYRQQAREVQDQLESLIPAVEDKTEAEKEAADAAARHREALDAVADAMEAQNDAALELVGGDIAVRDAQRDAAAEAEKLNDILEDQDTTLGEAGAAIDSAADSYLNAAAVAADYKAKQMEANGQTVDAATKAVLMKEELQRLSADMSGPLLAAIQGYIDQLNAIPKTIGTTIVLNKPGRVGDFAPTLGGGKKFHSGGVVPGPPGSEQVIIAKAGETVLPTHRAGAAGVGGTYNVTINVAQMLTPQQVVDAIKKHERFAGPGWRS